MPCEQVGDDDWLGTLRELKGSDEWNPRRSQLALLGCGAYGLPLAAHAKEAGMSTIYVGGLLQLLFGVRGPRWERQLEMGSAMNAHWRRPMAHEVPRGNTSLFGDGYSAYW